MTREPQNNSHFETPQLREARGEENAIFAARQGQICDCNRGLRARNRS